MARQIVTEPGYYGGKFLSAGQSFEDGEIASAEKVDFSTFTKDQLIAEAESRGVEIKPGATKAEIIKALTA